MKVHCMSFYVYLMVLSFPSFFLPLSGSSSPPRLFFFLFFSFSPTFSSSPIPRHLTQIFFPLLCFQSFGSLLSFSSSHLHRNICLGNTLSRKLSDTTKKWTIFDVLKPWSKKSKFFDVAKIKTSKKLIINFFDVLNSATSKKF
jgi:hypothetical protein